MLGANPPKAPIQAPTKSIKSISKHRMKKRELTGTAARCIPPYLIARHNIKYVASELWPFYRNAHLLRGRTYKKTYILVGVIIFHETFMYPGWLGGGVPICSKRFQPLHQQLFNHYTKTVRGSTAGDQESVRKSKSDLHGSSSGRFT